MIPPSPSPALDLWHVHSAVFGFNSSSCGSALASAGFLRFLRGNSSTMDPLTGSVLVTVCSCRIGKTQCHGAMNHLRLPSCHPPTQSMPWISMLTVHTVTFCENKVILSIFCAFHHTRSKVNTHTFVDTQISPIQLEEPVLLVMRASGHLAMLVNDSTCPLQRDTHCFNPCLRGD